MSWLEQLLQKEKHTCAVTKHNRCNFKIYVLLYSTKDTKFNNVWITSHENKVYLKYRKQVWKNMEKKMKAQYKVLKYNDWDFKKVN